MNISVPKVMGNIIIETVDESGSKNIAAPAYEDIYSKGYVGSYGSVVNIEIPRVAADVEIIVKAIRWYNITYKLSKATSTNKITRVREGESYNTVILPDDGYKLGPVKVYLAGRDITSSAVSADGHVSIPPDMVGDIHIKAPIQPIFYNIVYKLTRAKSSNTATTIRANSSYTTKITPTEGKEVESVSVKMGNNVVVSQTTPVKSLEFTIDKVTADLEITAVGSELKGFWVKFVLPPDVEAFFIVPAYDIDGRPLADARFKNGDKVQLDAECGFFYGDCTGKGIGEVTTQIDGKIYHCNTGKTSFCSFSNCPAEKAPLVGEAIVTVKPVEPGIPPATEFWVIFNMPAGTLAYFDHPATDINGRRIDQDSGVRFRGGDRVQLKAGWFSGQCYNGGLTRVTTEIDGYSFVCQEGLWTFGSLRMNPYGYVPLTGDVYVIAE